MGLKYEDAGVNKAAGYAEVKLIKELVKRTQNKSVLSSIGGFSGLYALGQYKDPVLVSGTDGVGTKLKLAFLMDKHNTVGEDAVAMCVNDILCQGAKPLFFLDYIGTGKLLPEKMASVVEGVVNGCVKGQMALIGGETAEMPGFYEDGEYDIAGFAVGVVERDAIIDGSKIQAGDVILGLPSTGVHSNGFSLVRKIIFDVNSKPLEEYYPELEGSLGESLLTPTKIYTKEVRALVENLSVHGLVHITGGGIYENVPRIMPEGLCATLDYKNVYCPPIFRLLQEWGGVNEEEMYGTFNMGIGMIVFVHKEDREKAMEILAQAGSKAVVLGEVVCGEEPLKLCR
ncbi:phosphoribosylformylglycinamidine cyclo-ligase [Peptostreptococcaceae bacterium oral taxon 113 str. W5053]|nr:phosphoribosylformylglycinamidine cyclo-ligase [Peptostreptococcaceae bacterium oral taxon 113 str. W5053]